MRTRARLIVIPAIAVVALFGPLAARFARGVGTGNISSGAQDTAGCSTDTTLCLSSGRFLVDATWTRPDGSSGIAHAVAITEEAGYFWILEPGNPEIGVKTLNGCFVNRRFWVFTAGLTNLAVTINVTDTTTNQTRTYSNPQGRAFEPIADTSAFSSCPAGAAVAGNPEEPSVEWSPAMPAVSRKNVAIGCTPADTVLCLSGRFQVEATWQTASGRSGSAHAASIGSEAGYLWFFDPSNVEVIVKSLDACAIARGNWFFGAGMTTAGLQLKVTDTFTGEVRSYGNSPGFLMLPILDTTAFAFCPTPTPTPTPTATPTATRIPSPTRTRTPTTTTVTLTTCRGFFFSAECFSPASVHVHVGDIVEWQSSTGTHSTTSGTCAPGESCAPDGHWNSGVQDSPFTVSRRFTQVGAFPYFCSVGHAHGYCCQRLGNICTSHCTTHVHETGTIYVDP